MTAAEDAVALFAEYSRQSGDGKPAFVLAHPAVLANATLAAIGATLSDGGGSPALQEVWQRNSGEQTMRAAARNPRFSWRPNSVTVSPADRIGSMERRPKPRYSSGPETKT